MLTRVLEPEVMDTDAEASDYDSMDHRAVNDVFVTDFLAAASAANVLPQVVDARQQTNENDENEDDESPPIDILDLGTGTARIPIALCRRCPQVRVVATDLAISMLEIARLNIEVASLRDRIRLDREDAKQLPYESANFLAVISNSIVHHIPAPQQALAEAVRVAGPGGILFIRDLLRPTDDASVTQLMELYAGQENEHSRAMFAASLRAALALDEIRAMVVDLGFPADGVQQTTDRHWTWIAQR